MDMTEQTFLNMTTTVKLGEVALNLRRYHKLNGYSLDVAAANSNMTVETLYNYENDKATPRMQDLKKLAKLYGIKVAHFFQIV